MIFVGIDPGFTNLGFALMQDGNTTHYRFTPRDVGVYNTVAHILEGIDPEAEKGIAVLERYVAYGGVTNSDSENILMLIGALHYGLVTAGFLDVRLMRAIDWKINLCKHLVKTVGFSNPSLKLDKKFSLAAAEQIMGGKPKTDHEADAVCLAEYGRLLHEGLIK